MQEQVQKIWGKTKKTVAYSFVSTKEYMGMIKAEEDPEFEKSLSDLSVLEQKANNLLLTLQIYGENLENLASSTNHLANSFSTNFTSSSLNYQENALATKNCTTKLIEICSNVNKINFPTTIVQPILDFIKEINLTKLLLPKCKKNRILLQYAQSELVSSQQKEDQEKMAKYSNEIDYRKTKFSNYRKKFIDDVTNLQSRRVDVFGKVFKSYRNHIGQVLKTTQENITESMKSLPTAQTQPVIPSLFNCV